MNMFASLTVGEIAAALTILAGMVTALALLSLPIRNLYKRLAKLERAVFDENGKTKFPLRYEFDDLIQDTKDIKDAVNIICDAMMVMLDSQINGDNEKELRDAKADLQRKRGIV